MTQSITSLQLNQAFGEAFGHIPSASMNILVMGMGESGQSMAKWALLQGAQVFIHDTRESAQLTQQQLTDINTLKELGIKDIYFGKDIADHALDQVHIIAMSPGLSPLQESIARLLTRASEKKIAVWGELDFFTQALRGLLLQIQYDPKVIAITGTNGKTTTTALTGLICEKAGKTVAVAGNISPALLDKLTQCLKDQLLPDIWVLELSSYQLFYSQGFNPHTAAILNISQDHLDWHGDMQHYAQSKAKILGEQTIAILNKEDPQVMQLVNQEDFLKKRVITFGMNTPVESDSFGIQGDMGGGIDWLAWAPPVEEFDGNRRVKVRRSKKSDDYADDALLIKNLIPAQALHIKGRHNATNALAALALANAVGLGIAQLLHGLRDYKGEPHRVQTIGIINDVEYIDDSKGTNVGAVIAAIQGLGMVNVSGHKKIILIAGGDGKGQDFKPLAQPIMQYVKHVYLIGRDAGLIAQILPSNAVAFTFSESLEDAVHQAAQIAVVGDQVLLSPACASFDMFKNYVARAKAFAAAVEELSTSSVGIQE